MVSYSRMETILFFHKMDTSSGRQRLEGLNAFAREVGWNVHCQSDPISKQDLASLVDLWKPVGAILSTNDGHTEYNASLFSPDNTVLQDCYPPSGIEKYTIVTTDSSATARLALCELAGGKCAIYGFVPWTSRRLWSENRRQHFMRLAALANLETCEFTPRCAWHDVAGQQRELAAWLKSLPRPIGIMAANDIVGFNVIAACRMAGIQVPFECKVVGVDNDELVCGRANPSLSSVELDFNTAGYKAGELLYRLVKGELGGKPLVSVPPLGFVRRGSSRVFLQTDRHALAASEMILAKACGKLHAKDVLATFPCSRRLAEIRFRKATGRSVLEEIKAVRIKRAKQLLADPGRELSAIAFQCGYDSETTFCRVFREETGMTMRGWRAANAAMRTR